MKETFALLSPKIRNSNLNLIFRQTKKEGFKGPLI